MIIPISEFEFATAKEIEGLEARKINTKKPKRNSNARIDTEGLRPIKKNKRAQYQPEQQLKSIRCLADIAEEDLS